MRRDPVIIIKEEGVLLVPEIFDLLLTHTNSYIRDSRNKLLEYVDWLIDHGKEGKPYDDPFIAGVLADLCRAMDLVREVEQLRKGVR